MPGKKKKFIDKKNAVTFHLVHRSQRDPLQADENAPQRVLLPTTTDQKPHKTCKEEQAKYGIFFDDDYDYMQHLRDVDELYDVEPVETFSQTKAENPSIKLPSLVFGSTAETDVGLLNRAAPVYGPKPDWDPDVVAALDEDFDFDDPDQQLEDDFVVLANKTATSDEDDKQSNLSEDEGVANIFKPVENINEVRGITQSGTLGGNIFSDPEEFDGSDVSSLGERTFSDMETKSRFTEYSMTSSVVPRNEHLTLLDNRFEKFYEQYDDEEIGALDHDEITGYMKRDSQLFAHVMDEFEKEQHPPRLKDVVEKDKDILQLVGEEDDEDGDDDLVKMVVEPVKEKWDCESILSTYSTLYNHPQLIKEPKNKPVKLTKHAGIPADTLPAAGLTRRQLGELAKTRSTDKANTYRCRGESAEERRQRKQAIKEERRMRREQKKANKLAFKCEKLRQEKDLLNLKHNIQALSLT